MRLCSACGFLIAYGIGYFLLDCMLNHVQCLVVWVHLRWKLCRKEKKILTMPCWGIDPNDGTVIVSMKNFSFVRAYCAPKVRYIEFKLSLFMLLKASSIIMIFFFFWVVMVPTNTTWSCMLQGFSSQMNCDCFCGFWHLAATNILHWKVHKNLFSTIHSEAATTYCVNVVKLKHTSFCGWYIVPRQLPLLRHMICIFLYQTEWWCTLMVIYSLPVRNIYIYYRSVNFSSLFDEFNVQKHMLNSQHIT